MALFALMTSEDTPALEAKIKELFPNAYLQVEPRQWFLIGSGTAKDVSERLGITSGVSGSGIVISVGGYYGRAGTNVWEWIASKSSTTAWCLSLPKTEQPHQNLLNQILPRAASSPATSLQCAPHQAERDDSSPLR
jgi:hypothetical protein